MALSHDSDSTTEGSMQEDPQQPNDNAVGGPESLAATDEPPPLETRHSPRHRTRSQTGSTAKRRLPEDMLPPSSSSQKTSAPRKKQRPASKKSSSPADTESQEGIRTDSPVIDSKDVSQPTTRSSSPFSSTPPLTFLESSASPGYAPERRGPRSRATLPVPVPNLIKKSRGRRVPTQEAAEEQVDPKDKRTYICKVEGCGKCFHRGEHLKRHIRSIHTHEKPFKCTHPSCGKFFNRHDNLLQHLKVHKQNHSEENGNPRPILQLSPGSLSPTSEPEQAMDHEDDSSVSDSEISEVPLPAPIKSTLPIAVPVIYDTYISSTRFDVACESFTTNMAVSSLRTELPPHSPPTSRVRDSL